MGSTISTWRHSHPGPYDEFFSKQFFYFSTFEIARRTHNRILYVISYWIGANIAYILLLLLSFRRIAQVYTSSFIFTIYYYCIHFFFFFYTCDKLFQRRARRRGGQANFRPHLRTVYTLGLYYCCCIIILSSYYANRRRRRRFEHGATRWFFKHARPVLLCLSIIILQKYWKPIGGFFWRRIYIVTEIWTKIYSGILFLTSLLIL